MVRWLLINTGSNISVHNNWIDASCNHSQVLHATGGKVIFTAPVGPILH
jgi:hypothetical protein